MPWQFCVSFCDLFGMVSSRDPFRSCWWPPTFVGKKVTAWITWGSTFQQICRIRIFLVGGWTKNTWGNWGIYNLTCGGRPHNPTYNWWRGLPWCHCGCLNKPCHLYGRNHWFILVEIDMQGYLGLSKASLTSGLGIRLGIAWQVKNFMEHMELPWKESRSLLNSSWTCLEPNVLKNNTYFDYAYSKIQNWCLSHSQ